MLKDLERIAGKVANAPRPPLPDGMIEVMPDLDSPEMLLGETDAAYLPAGVVVEYRDDQNQMSVRRVTLVSAAPDGEDPSFTGFCHSRQDMRRFRFARPLTIIDPHGAASSYGSPIEFLDRFRYDGDTKGPNAAMYRILSTVRDELMILMFFSRCDGYLHPAEQSVVMSFIREACGELEIPDDAVWEIVRRLYPDSRTMLNSARHIIAEKGLDRLTMLQKTIRTLIEADGIVHSDEALHAIELSFLK